MNTDDRQFLESLTERVTAAICEASNTLGVGFLEKVYERALQREPTLRGISATAQASFAIVYKGRYVREHAADILVEDALVIERKFVDRLANEHRHNA
jgi:GxxExxY protein